LSSLTTTINSQISESVGENQPRFDYGLSSAPLSISGIVNSVFLYLSKDWNDVDRNKLVMDDMESRNFDALITPLVWKVARLLGLAVEEIGALVALGGLLLPRVFMYVSLGKKYSKEHSKQNTLEAKKPENPVEGVVNS